MINNDVNAGSFIYCMTHWGPYEVKKIHNVGNGLYHQYTYLIDGNLKIEFRDSPDGDVKHILDSTISSQKFLDHAPLPKYETVSTQADGVTAMFFNPISETRLLNVEIYKEGSYTVGLADKRMTIVCIQKEVYANGNKIMVMQHATIFPGKTAKLVVPENSICALVSYSDNLDDIIELLQK